MVGDLARPQNMAAALADVDAVIHSAGLAHAMSGLPEDDYRMLNTEATIGLARAAQRAGARRFVFLSSIRAQSGPDRRGRADRGPGAAADRRLWPLQARRRAGPGRARPRLGRAAARAGLWPGVKGNMAELVRFARSPYPLPLGALAARRSLLSLDNLVAAVDAVLAAPGPLRRPLIVADPRAADHSRHDRGDAARLGRRPGLLPVPPRAARSRRCGRADAAETYQRLAGSLVADPAALMRLSWAPPVSTPRRLAALARG